MGFENNSMPIRITVTYNSNGELSYYKFSYGGQPLVEFYLGHYDPTEIEIPYLIISIVLAAIELVEIIIYMWKGKE